MINPILKLRDVKNTELELLVQNHAYSKEGRGEYELK